MLNYKRKTLEDSNKNKKQVIEIFDKLMKNSNSISPETILEMFPGDQKLINKLLYLREVTRSGSPMIRSAYGNNQSTSLNNSF